MGLILSDKQEVEIAKRVIVFVVCSTVDSCVGEFTNVGGGGLLAALLKFMNFHFHRVSSLYPFQLTVDLLRRLRLNSVLLRAKGSFVSFAWY